MINCLYCCMHCVMLFCIKSGARPCRSVQSEASCSSEIGKNGKKKFLQWALWLIIADMLCWSADLKWAGAGPRQIAVAVIHDCLSGSSNNSGVGLKFPCWYCSTVWTTVSSWQKLVLDFGAVRDCLSFPSLGFLPLQLFFLLLSSFETLTETEDFSMKKKNYLVKQDQTAVTHHPPPPSLCTLDFVSPFTL